MTLNKITLISITIVVLGLFTSACEQPKEPVDYVDPFIGTDFFAHMFPGPGLPFGMVHLSPDVYTKGWTYASGYKYADNSIMGFSHTHYSGVGMVAKGDLLIMPTVGQKPQVAPGSRENPDEGYRSRFDHADETASPGYYSVYLKDYGIEAELTVTKRAGMHRYTFPESENAHILIDLGHIIGDAPTGKSHLEFVNSHTIEGYKLSQEATLYFVAEFSKPFAAYGTWDGNYATPESGASLFPYKSAESGSNIGAFVNYRTSFDETIFVKVGVSYVSVEGARNNLKAEIPGWDFDSVRSDANNIWNRELKKIEIAGGSEDQKQVFYTALYHSLLAQVISSDMDGKYFGMDGKIHVAEDYDVDFIFEAMREKATGLPPPPLPESAGRSGIKYYMELGYTPVDRVTESVPNTLELTYNDWCIAQMAQELGRESDYKLFMKRAHNYLNLFDPGTNFMRPRNHDGSWLKSCENRPAGIVSEGDHTYYGCFDPLLVGRRPNRNYTESNAWQYIWSVQHDINGLVDLFGTTSVFVSKLDSLFSMSPEITGPKYVGVVGTIGQYVHGNQPSHHVAYLYNYAGMPWKTQERVSQVMDLYRTGPGGICGNEDMGSLSSWYVLSAMGIYPVCPGQNLYLIGTPIFEKATIRLNSPYDAGEFTIQANQVSTVNKYIQSATLNGESMSKTWLSHEDIIQGGTLIFEMGPEPNLEWGSNPADIPPSMTR